MSTSSSSTAPAAGGTLARIAKKSALLLVLIALPLSYTELRLRKGVTSESLSYQYRYDEIFNNRTNSDVVVLGTSHGANGLMPSRLNLTGHRVYNFCFNGASPTFNLHLYRDLISKHYPKPKLVLYDVNTLIFDDKLLWRKPEHDLRFTKESSLKVVTDRLQITRENNVWDAFKESFKKKPNTILVEYYDNGFAPGVANFKQEARYDSIRQLPKEMESFETLLDLFKSQHIPVIFVDLPVYQDGGNPAAQRKVGELLRGIASRRGIAMLDYNEERRSAINSDRELFSDYGHLNYRGAQLFSTRLGADLRALLEVSRGN